VDDTPQWNPQLIAQGIQLYALARLLDRLEGDEPESV